MAGGWWRLLAAFLLILATALLRAQSAAVAGCSAPVLPANSQLLRYAPASGEGWISSPCSTGNAPVGSPPVGRSPRGPVSTGFGQIAHPAAIIFSGTVTAIEPASSKRRISTAITFKVNEPVRGVSPGQMLTIHEWAALWSRGERYRVGERVCLFLYAPSRLGLTSPVAGGMGRFTVNSAGKILLNPQHVQLLATDPILGGKTVLSSDEIVRALQRAGVSMRP